MSSGRELREAALRTTAIAKAVSETAREVKGRAAQEGGAAVQSEGVTDAGRGADRA